MMNPEPMQPTTAIFTSIAANYLPKARVLAESVKRHAPQVHFALVLTDAVPGSFDLAAEPFDELLTIEQLGIPDWEQWLFQHTVMEACTGVKPFALLKLLQQHGQVFYFDPDIVLFSSLERLQAQLASASVVLTPHTLAPETELRAVIDNELTFLARGLYNLGFIGVRQCDEGRRCARWWADRCLHFCFDDVPAGIYTDQKWIDFVPLYFDDVTVLEDPGCNVCTWNYTQRHIAGDLAAGFTVNGQPLVFHHFSGYDSGAHAVMRDRYGKAMPATLALSDWYGAECRKAGEGRGAKARWAYDCYENGAPVWPSHRQLLRQRADLRAAFHRPFALKPEGVHALSYYHWLEREGLLGQENLRFDPGVSFGAFLRQTEYGFIAILQRTPRLPRWIKRAVRALVRAFFSLLRGGGRMVSGPR